MPTSAVASGEAAPPAVMWMAIALQSVAIGVNFWLVGSWLVPKRVPKPAVTAPAPAFEA